MQTTLFLLLLIFGISLYAQEPNLNSLFEHQFFTKITNGLGYRFLNKQRSNLEPIFFEVQLPLPLRYAFSNKWQATASIQSILRMYDEPNYPIKTPDYKVFSMLHYHTDTWRFALAAMHHSNGQKDSLFLPNHALNTSSGNFSVNSMQFFAQKSLPNACLQHITFKTEHLVFLFSVKDMKRFYFHHAAHLFLYLQSINRRFSLQQKLSFFYSPEHQRFGVQTILFFHLFKPKVSPFVHFMFAPDYYNTRYLYQNLQLSFGIAKTIPWINL